jgi:LysM repeat protein/ABC-type branched-subunit amino acid transport system substrate-binding protein
MVKSGKRVLIFFLVLIVFSNPGMGQVAVERSKDKVIISGRPYYIHIVKKGETAYSISKAYDTTPQGLAKENPGAEKGVKTGQSLRIPIVEVATKPKSSAKPLPAAKDETRFIYHKLSPGETVFALSKKYGVSEEDIIQSNPGIEISKMAVGFEVAIPKRDFMNNDQKLQVPEKNYIEYKVIKGDNLYSISKKFGITVRELRRENRGLLFPKVDDLIRIPVTKITEAEQIEKVKPDSIVAVPEKSEIKPERSDEITLVHKLKGSYKLALMLPLYIGENEIRTEIDSSRFIKGKRERRTIMRPEDWIYPGSVGFLELYEGVLLAADTLRSLGLDIDIHLYDIMSDTIEVTRLIESGELKDMDMIIGPVYSHNLSQVAAYANNYEIPVISPVPLRNNMPLDSNPYLFMANPSLEVAQNAMAKRLTDYSGDNFIFIHSDSTHLNPDIDSFKSKIFRELTTKVPYEDIRFKEFIFYSRSMLDEDSINRLEHALTDGRENFVIIASEEAPMISECISNLKTLSKKYNIRVIGYPAMRVLDNEDWKDYFDLGTELFTPYWIDYNSQDVINFNAAFRQKFFTEPFESSFAWMGYDITYYFLSGLSMHGKRFLRDPGIHNPDLLQTSFRFQRKADGSGFENQKLFLIKLTNEMEVKLLDVSSVTNDESIK